MSGGAGMPCTCSTMYKINKLSNQVDILRKALIFYTDPTLYQDRGIGIVADEETARTALKECFGED